MHIMNKHTKTRPRCVRKL